MTKAECRTIYKQKREALSIGELAEGSRAICKLLTDMDWKAVTYLHTYIPMVHKKEPDVWTFVQYFKDMYLQKKVVVSRSNLQDCSMQHFLFSNDSQLEVNAWGILEPTGGETVSAKLLEVVLVPLLACDVKGNRVGYGKGFYDRFLSECHPDCRKIGVSFFEPMEELIDDVSSLDIPLDEVIFPKGIQQLYK